MLRVTYSLYRRTLAPARMLQLSRRRRRSAGAAWRIAARFIATHYGGGEGRQSRRSRHRPDNATEHDPPDMNVASVAAGAACLFSALLALGQPQRHRSQF